MRAVTFPRPQSSALNRSSTKRLIGSRFPGESKLATGFTLLELLLALGLAVLLMAAIYSALDLYWRFSSAGREQMERAQLARVLLQRIADDIRSVVFTEVPPAETTDQEASTIQYVLGDEGSGSSTSEDGSQQVRVEEASDDTLRPSIGIVGDAYTLTLHVNRPSTAWSLVTPETALVEPPNTEQREVTWYVGVPGQTALTGSMATTAVPADLSATFSGLSRMEGERLVTAAAAATGDPTLMLQQTTNLAPEVSFVQFRYFDGAGWFDAWDSTLTGYLPQAIEITLGLTPSREEVPVVFGLDASVADEVYRLVVPVPLAEPFRTPTEPAL